MSAQLDKIAEEIQKADNDGESLKPETEAVAGIRRAIATNPDLRTRGEALIGAAHRKKRHRPDL